MAGEGLTDEWTCDGCGQVYDETSYLARLRSASALWVPATVAAKTAHRSVRTVRSWVNRWHVTAACRVADHTVVVWWPDVSDRAFRWTEERTEMRVDDVAGATAYEKPARRITRYVKRPVEVEAWWWDGTAEGASPIIDWMLSVGATASYHDPSESPSFPKGRINVPTLEGSMTALPGDYIIRGIQGEFYPCKPDIFEATYDPA